MTLKELKQMLSEHKYEIIVGAGVGVALVVALKYVSTREVKATIGVTEIIADTNNVVPRPEQLINVKQHVRNLPSAWKPSQEKLLLAKALCIPLGPNQTIVNPYCKVVA